MRMAAWAIPWRLHHPAAISARRETVFLLPGAPDGGRPISAAYILPGLLRWAPQQRPALLVEPDEDAAALIATADGWGGALVGALQMAGRDTVGDQLVDYDLRSRCRE